MRWWRIVSNVADRTEMLIALMAAVVAVAASRLSRTRRDSES